MNPDPDVEMVRHALHYYGDTIPNDPGALTVGEAALSRISSRLEALADERNRYAQEADEWEKNCIRLRAIEEAARAAFGIDDIHEAMESIRTALEGSGDARP